MSNEDQYRPRDVQHYPLHMIVAIINPTATTNLIGALVAAGTTTDAIDVAQGDADADRIVDETERGALGRITRLLAPGEEYEQRDQYVQALRSGHAVVRVVLHDAAQKEPIARVLAEHGGRFINYYGRWTVESLSS